LLALKRLFLDKQVIPSLFACLEETFPDKHAIVSVFACSQETLPYKASNHRHFCLPRRNSAFERQATQIDICGFVRIQWICGV
jgi:hypothetical protein